MSAVHEAERRLALQIDCPVCQQPPGEECRPASHAGPFLHSSRIEAMRVLRRVARVL